MRLIEKECPNCGAGLSFTMEDTSCKCEYCKREFEIERDTEKRKLDDQFSLSELKTPFKIFSYITFGSFIIQAIIFLIVFVIIIIVGVNIINGLNDSDSIFNRNASLIEEISELKSSDYSTIDLNSNILFSKETISTRGSYITKGNLKRESVYILSKKKSNYLISVYKVVYEKIGNSNDMHILYVPIKYSNVKNRSNSIAFSLDNGEIAAPEYYFDDSNTDYTYGYGDIDTLYKEVIEKYQKNYKITKK